jgi:hypothetical protein
MNISRRQRRLHVLGLYGGYLAVALSWALASHLGQPLLFVLVIAFGLVFLNSLVKLGLGHKPWNITGKPDAELDERQVQLRNRVYYLAYGLLSSILGVGLIYWYIATDAQRLALWLPSSPVEVGAVFWGLLLLLSSLPTAVLAWLEPDFLPEEVSEPRPA